MLKVIKLKKKKEKIIKRRKEKRKTQKMGDPFLY
jgi:hypothetical protein